MKITVLLRNDHEALKALFDRFRQPGAPKEGGARDLFSEIRREILIHSQMESEIFYPAIAATSSAHATELISRAMREHRSVERLLTELNTMNRPDKTFDAKMDQLVAEVLQHMEMEEEIFDEARKNLPEYRLEELGLELEDRRKILTTMAA